jgi:putative Mn2+ efflux pump MntP
VSNLSILLLALGLAADATAASATLGLGLARVHFRHVLSVTVWFGLSQGGMALIGSVLGSSFGAYLAAWDHWLAFIVLAGLGAKMIWEAFQSHEASETRADAFAFGTMLLLAFATSVDALAVGVTLPLLGAPVGRACAVIGLITALLSTLGLFLGRHFGERLGRRVDLFGGALLIVLGLKILLEHLGLIG